MKEVPKLYKQYPFFDDGKYSPSRFYVATVVKILNQGEAFRHMVNTYDENGQLESKSVYDIWKEAVESCKSDYVYPHNKDGYWCYAPETDYFVVCAIPEYDDSLIFFARHINGGWLSFETTGSWQCGKLDVDCEQFSRYKEDYPEIYNKHKDLFNAENNS